MKLKIIEEGVIVDGVEKKVGDHITVKGDEIPSSLVNKAVEIGVGDRELVVNPAEQKAELKGPFTVGEVVSGWAPVLDADGKKVKSLRKADAEVFVTMSPEDQLAYLSE